CSLLDAEASLLLVASRRGFHQPNYTILAVAIQIAIGIDQRAFTYAAIAPRNLTSVKIDSSQYRTREPVKVITDQHRAAVMVPHVFREPDLLRLVVRFDFDNAATRTVVGGDKDAIAARNRRRHVRRPVRRMRVVPE